MKEDTLNIISGLLRGSTAGGLVAHLTGAAKTMVAVTLLGHPVTIPLTVVWMVGGGAVGGLTAKCINLARDVALAKALRRMQAYEN